MTLTLDQARANISTKFLTDWSGTTEVMLENESAPETLKKPWVRLTIKNQLGEQHTLGPTGNRIFRRHGTVFVQVFVPENAGTKLGDTLAQQARNILEAVRLGDIVFEASQVREVGPDGKWFQHVVETPFGYDDLK